MIYSETTNVMIDCMNVVSFDSVITSQLDFQITIRPTSVVITSATNPACVIDNPTANKPNISFRNNSNVWTTGMRNRNYRIAYNQITTDKAGGNIQHDVAIRINQNGF